LEITVTNPVAEGGGGSDRAGNRLALDNIRQRLRLAYGEEGALEIAREPGVYRATVRFPHQE
jgi:two-component system sensor histidine kinase AlgZ